MSPLASPSVDAKELGTPGTRSIRRDGSSSSRGGGGGCVWKRTAGEDVKARRAARGVGERFHGPLLDGGFLVVGEMEGERLGTHHDFTTRRCERLNLARRERECSVVRAANLDRRGPRLRGFVLGKLDFIGIKLCETTPQNDDTEARQSRIRVESRRVASSASARRRRAP